MTSVVSPLARFGHALSDETRLQMLELLRDSPRYPGEMVLELNVSKQSVSNHLACLKGCGLVIAIQEGRKTRYELSSERVRHALNDLKEVVLISDPAACDEAETKDCC